jgi:aryl-alcohol dehydrogenase-like predicted oxidoreductase
MMTEAFAFENQQLSDSFASPIAAATDLGLTVMASAPLNQGRLAKPLLSQLEQFLPDFETPAQMALQFVRSTPGIMTTTVGMRALDHVRDNCELLSIAPASAETIASMFKWNAADGE